MGKRDSWSVPLCTTEELLLTDIKAQGVSNVHNKGKAFQAFLLNYGRMNIMVLCERITCS